MAEGANGSRTYEEFEPFCKWHREEGEDIIDIQLHDFKKEQLKVQSNNRGILLITGEKPAKGPKWIHFRKEIKLPKDCIVPEIRAKFNGGVLTITMPKMLPVQTVTDDKGKSAITRGVTDEKFGLKGLKIRKRTAIRVSVVVVLTVVMVTFGAYWSGKYRKPVQSWN